MPLDHTNDIKLASTRLNIFARHNQNWPAVHDIFKGLIHDNLK